MTKVYVKKSSKYYQTKEQIISSIIKTYIQAYEIKCNNKKDIESLLKQIAAEVILETLS